MRIRAGVARGCSMRVGLSRVNTGMPASRAAAAVHLTIARRTVNLRKRTQCLHAANNRSNQGRLSGSGYAGPGEIFGVQRSQWKDAASAAGADVMPRAAKRP